MPPEVQEAGFDKIRVFPFRGERPYQIGNAWLGEVVEIVDPPKGRKKDPEELIPGD